MKNEERGEEEPCRGRRERERRTGDKRVVLERRYTRSGQQGKAAVANGEKA